MSGDARGRHARRRRRGRRWRVFDEPRGDGRVEEARGEWAAVECRATRPAEARPRDLDARRAREAVLRPGRAHRPEKRVVRAVLQSLQSRQARAQLSGCYIAHCHEEATTRASERSWAKTATARSRRSQIRSATRQPTHRACARARATVGGGRGNARRRLPVGAQQSLHGRGGAGRVQDGARRRRARQRPRAALRGRRLRIARARAAWITRGSRVDVADQAWI